MRRNDRAVIGSEALLDRIVALLDQDKAENVIVIELAGKSAIADAMVVATGGSQRHLGAMAEHLLLMLKENGIIGVRPEGLSQGDWVLIDAGDVIVHLFRSEVRMFYGLEKIWGMTVPEPEPDRSAGFNA